MLQRSCLKNWSMEYLRKLQSVQQLQLRQLLNLLFDNNTYKFILLRNSIIFSMEETYKTRRSLRNTNPCNPIPNFFKTQNEFPQRLVSVPLHVIGQVKKFSSLTCQQISKMSFPHTFGQNPNSSLNRAKDASKIQQQYVHKKYPQSILQQAKIEEDSLNNTKKLKFTEPQLIRSQDGQSLGQGIFNNKMFRSDIENLLLN